MNIVDIIILAVLAYALLAGIHRGFLASFLSGAGFVGAWFAAQSVYPKIANFALSNTTLMAVLNQYLEPDTFFANHTEAMANVSDVIAGGESAISAAVNSVGERFSFIAEAFSANVRNQAFSNLGIHTMADYLDQTLWMAVFNVVAFIFAFIVIYAVISCLVNLLDHVISFPVLRGFDWLLGGVLGLLKGSVVVVLILTIMPVLTTLIDPQLTTQLQTTSVFYNTFRQFDLLQVARTLAAAAGGTYIR